MAPESDPEAPRAMASEGTAPGISMPSCRRLLRRSAYTLPFARSRWITPRAVMVFAVARSRVWSSHRNRLWPRLRNAAAARFMSSWCATPSGLTWVLASRGTSPGAAGSTPWCISVAITMCDASAPCS
ncbi:TPA_asm: UL25.5 [Human alphaherpesvirus 1]|nr:TPA_asm: UL25.5 [Human alphaherpesvirus 1]